MFRRRARSDHQPAAARQDVLDALQPWIVASRRPGWRPLVTPGEPTDGRSKFCGAAWLVAGEPPPTCTQCGRPLQLFVQVDLDDLPGEASAAFGTGLLQLFYCVGQRPGEADDGKPECFAESAWEPFSDAASVVRVVSERSIGPAAATVGATDPFRPMAIVGWERFEDLPDPEDHEVAGLESSYDFDLKTVTLKCPSVALDATLGIDDLGVEDIARAAERDKLAGWPAWIQSSEYPSCPTCGEVMRVVFQVDSGDHVPFMFGDAGIGHITQCPVHHDVVAFAWACS